MRKMIVAGNWKMYGSSSESELLLKSLIEGEDQAQNCDLIVFPPYVYLHLTQALLQDTDISWGAQDVSFEPKGAFTGEISANMLRDMGCKYTLVGHSERRQYHEETNEQVAKKFIAATIADIKPILCVGETLAERTAGQTLQIVSEQINALLDLENGVKSLYNGVIAYEPVWAIGTGQTATPEEAQEIHSAIRELIAVRDPDLAQRLPLLYGGSVKRENAESLFAMPDIDGGLIGGASLDAQHFLDIAKLCNKY